MINATSRLSLYLCCLLVLIPVCGWGENIVFENDSEILKIGGAVEILADSTSSMSPVEAFQASGYNLSNADVPNLSVSTTTFWIKFTITNRSKSDRLIIELAYANMDFAALHIFDGSHLSKSTELGQHKVFSNRPHPYIGYLFDAHLPINASRTYLLQVKSGEQIMLPINVGTALKMAESGSSRELFAGIYVGFILVMLLYNLFIYFSVRDTSYLLYVIYLITVGLTQIDLLGFGFKYLWPNSPYIAQQAAFWLPSLVGFTLSAFVANFLRTKRHVPQLHKVLFALSGVYLMAIIFGILQKHNLAYILVQANGLAFAVTFLIIGIKVTRKRVRSGRFFLIAWTLFLIGVCFFAFKDFGILPYNDLSIYTMPFGSALEVTLLSIALADRINVLKNENERIIKDQNIILSKKVKERTQELQTTNKDLIDAQAKLVESEKMASLGVLTAGIAHEINNPLTFVKSNVQPLERDFNILLQILEAYEKIEPEHDISTQIASINQLKQELESEYVKQEIQDLLEGIEVGANRTAKIVQGLRTFSRSESKAYTTANILVGIESTLTLLNYQLREGNITLEKKLRPLPLIDCLPDQLNQVFMNVIHNAIDAVKTKTNGEKKVTVESKATQDTIELIFSDTGPGIPAPVLERIFDPFFTTKEVGSGVGLGLSIAYGIVKEHNGEIKVETDPEKGTTFKIIIPTTK